jgi:hypothetical protein
LAFLDIVAKEQFGLDIQAVTLHLGAGYFFIVVRTFLSYSFPVNSNQMALKPRLYVSIGRYAPLVQVTADFRAGIIWLQRII